MAKTQKSGLVKVYQKWMADTASLSLMCPRKLLPNGDYRVLLTRRLSDGSFEEMLGYSFRVVQ
jgi:hypothetical protein